MSAPRSHGSLRAAGWLVIMTCLLCSLAQASRFLQKAGVDEFQKWLLVFVAAGILFGSPVLSRYVGMMMAARGSGAAIFVAIITILCVETFSVGTSASSMTNALLGAERRENTTSPEYIAAAATVELYQQQAMAYQSQSIRQPEGWRTRAMELSESADQSLRNLERAQARLAAVDVSTTGRSLDAIESRTGLGASELGLLGAFLLSAVMFSVSLCMGVTDGRTFRRPEFDAGKHEAQR